MNVVWVSLCVVGPQRVDVDGDAHATDPNIDPVHTATIMAVRVEPGLYRDATPLCQGFGMSVSDLLHPILAERSSPRRFDPVATISGKEVDSLLDAARLAPSAGNSQPWSFIVARRHDADHRRLTRYLAGSSAPWAPDAALLVANLSLRWVEQTDWEYSEFALYDVGQAVAHMTFQAAHLGLAVRQFRAFDRDGVATEFAVPSHWEVTSISAIGRSSGNEEGEDVRGKSPVHRRRSIEEIRWPG